MIIKIDSRKISTTKILKFIDENVITHKNI